MHRPFIIPALALGAIVVPVLAEGEAVKLKYAPKIGQREAYVYRSETTRESVAGDKTSTQRGEFEITLALTAKALNPDSVSFELRLLRYVLKDDQMRGGTFDSSKPDADDLAKTLAPDVLPLLDKPLRIRVNDAGQIVGMDGVQDLPQTKALPRLRTQLLEAEVLNRALRPIFTTRAPEDTSAPGQSWTSKDQNTVAPGVFAIATNTHTLSEIEGDRATIDVKASVEWPTIPERNGVTVKSIETTFSAAQTWDVAASRLSRYESDQRTVSDLVTPQGPMKQDTRAKVTIIPAP